MVEFSWCGLFEKRVLCRDVVRVPFLLGEGARRYRFAGRKREDARGLICRECCDA